MPKLKIIFSLLFASVCLAAAAAAPGASALTGYTCHPMAMGPFNDQLCNVPTAGSGSYTHLPFTQKKTTTTYENDPPTRFTVAKLHGVANVEVSCGTVKGSGSVENEEVGAATNLVGSGKLAFTECTTNQTGCTAKVAEAEFKFEGVEGLTEEGVGLKFQPASGTKITTVTFEGTCGLHAFGAIPVSGSAIGTANGEPKGLGAQTVFGAGSMESVTVGGEPAAVEARVTITHGGEWIVTTA